MLPVTIYPHPPLRSPVMVAAFAGWPDAQEGATGAVRYLLSHLPVQHLADLDPEEFYDFTRLRPFTYLTEQGERQVRWPSNSFACWHGEEAPRDLVLFLGIEPHLKWKTFARSLLAVAEECGVSLVVVLGSLLDSVPHTREVKVSGSANRPDLRQALEEMGVRISRYQGPTGAPTALMEACTQRGLPYASLWGHSPYYLQNTTNPKVSYALLQRLSRLLSLPLDLEELAKGASAFEAEVTRAVRASPEVSAHLRALEEKYDEGVPSTPGELPPSQEVLREVEEFLRRQKGEGGGPPDEER